MTTPLGMAMWSQVFSALAVILLIGSSSEARSISLGKSETGSANFVCDACLEFSAEAQTILSDPEIQRQAVDAVSQMACHSPIPKLKTKCLDMVNQYVPDALHALQTYLGPDVCTETGLCLPDLTGSRKRQMNRALADARNRALADPRTCLLCEEFARDALSYLGSNVTKSKIIGALHLACSKLEDISQQCDLLVDVYAPSLIEHLDDLTPEEFCKLTHLCNPTFHSTRALHLKRNDCAICQFVILELKVKLRNPATQERLMEILLNECNRVQNHVDECKRIVQQYALTILANLDTVLDADALCTKLKACDSRQVDVSEPVLALYSEGQTRRHRHHWHVHAL